MNNNNSACSSSSGGIISPALDCLQMITNCDDPLKTLTAYLKSKSHHKLNCLKMELGQVEDFDETLVKLTDTVVDSLKLLAAQKSVDLSHNDEIKEGGIELDQDEKERICGKLVKNKMAIAKNLEMKEEKGSIDSAQQEEKFAIDLVQKEEKVAKNTKGDEIHIVDEFILKFNEIFTTSIKEISYTNDARNLFSKINRLFSTSFNEKNYKKAFEVLGECAVQLRFRASIVLFDFLKVLCETRSLMKKADDCSDELVFFLNRMYDVVERKMLAVANDSKDSVKFCCWKLEHRMAKTLPQKYDHPKCKVHINYSAGRACVTRTAVDEFAKIKSMYHENELENEICKEYDVVQLFQCVKGVVGVSREHGRNVAALEELANFLDVASLRLSGVEKAVEWMKLQFQL